MPRDDMGDRMRSAFPAEDPIAPTDPIQNLFRLMRSPRESVQMQATRLFLELTQQQQYRKALADALEDDEGFSEALEAMLTKATMTGGQQMEALRLLRAERAKGNEEQLAQVSGVELASELITLFEGIEAMDDVEGVPHGQRVLCLLGGSWLEEVVEQRARELVAARDFAAPPPASRAAISAPTIGEPLEPERTELPIDSAPSEPPRPPDGIDPSAGWGLRPSHQRRVRPDRG